MTNIESKIVLIQAKPEDVFNFLNDFNNFGKLMPEQISNWQSTKDTCSFTISGMATLNMKIEERKEFSLVKYAADGKNPFDYSLITNIFEQENGDCTTQIVFQADLNPMLKMLASKPLENFVNLLVEKLKQHIETNA